MKTGFIGVGNMGAAMLKSVVNLGKIFPEDIIAYDIDENKLAVLVAETGARAAASAGEAVEFSDTVILAVKPNMVKSVLESCKSSFTREKVLVSVAAGLPIKFYKGIIGEDKKVIRTMPNTPALVGEGMTIMSYDESVGSREAERIRTLFECMGKVEVLDEKLMNEVTALTGSSPAYVFIFLEAMADAAVRLGIPRDTAYRLAAQAVLGSAKMLLETGRHPGELKDQVCSPGGTTIEAVAALEKNGFRHAVMDAVAECAKKAKEIGKQFEK